MLKVKAIGLVQHLLLVSRLQHLMMKYTSQDYQHCILELEQEHVMVDKYLPQCMMIHPIYVLDMLQWIYDIVMVDMMQNLSFH